MNECPHTRPDPAAPHPLPHPLSDKEMPFLHPRTHSVIPVSRVYASQKEWEKELTQCPLRFTITT